MSSQAAFNNQYYPSRQHPGHSPEEESEPHYDDPVDEYGSPYSKNSPYSVDPPSPLQPYDHRRRPSQPLAPKTSYTSSEYTAKESQDTTGDRIPRAYPPPPAAKESDVTPLWQQIVPESLACRLYILTVLVQTTIDLAIEGDLLIRFQQAVEQGEITESAKISSRKMPVYLSIFALAHIFQFVMAVDAVYARNTLQFICLTLFNALFLAYAIIQIGEIRSSLNPSATAIAGISHIPIEVLTTIIPVVISVAEVAYIGLGWKIYNEFGWKVYKLLGADRRIKKMYATYQIFECIVKFDVFFWVGFSVQFIWLVLQKSDWEYYVTCAALPLSILLLIEGHLATRHENKWMMATFMSGCVGALVYFIYKLSKVITNRKDPQFQSIFKSLSTFSVIAIALLVVTFIFAVIVMRNFGRGLKEALARKRDPPSHQRYPSHSAHHRRAASTNLNRMSIE